METSEDLVSEYVSQLAGINELLEASPDDESLLSLKKDLEELLALTTATLTPIPATEQEETAKAVSSEHERVSQSLASAVTTTDAADAAAAGVSEGDPSNKKLKKVKDFEIPEHLLPLETDTEAETNRKRRSVKALKNKWRERKKEVESSKKQQSWQNFQHKKKRKDKSIFATQDGVNAKVGVISAGSMTEFEERKRHKHA